MVLQTLEVHTAIHGADADVRAFGDLDLASSHVLHDAVLAHVDAADGPIGVAIDLRGVAFCDAAGITSVLEACETVRRGGGAVTVASSAPVRRVFEVAGLRQVLDTPPS